MNSAIILPEELSNPTLAHIRGKRALYLFETHELRTGLVVQASILGGRRGTAEVLSAKADEIILRLSMGLQARERTRITLIVAVPRPQTVKKVVQLASCLGVTSLHFIKAKNVEKSYLQSKSLKEESLKFEVIKGLEQSYDSMPPEIEIHPEYWRFRKEVLPEILQRHPGSARYILHTSMQQMSERIEAGREQHVLLAIGPESGWSDTELDDFLQAGFQQLSLGARVLRVEHAAAFALSRVEYTRAISSLR